MIWKSMFQIVAACYAFAKVGWVHNDMHCENIWVLSKPPPQHEKAVQYIYEGNKFLLKAPMPWILIYDFDTDSGKLKLLENGITTLPKGSGPRHFTFNADGTKMYVINELGSKMMVFDVDNEGLLKLIQTLPTTRETYEENNYCADIHIGKNGEFLYGSNRGENTIVTFRIGIDGLLTLAGHTSCGGDWPRNFVIDPSGKFLLVGNQKSDSVSVFKLDRRTGLPKEPDNDYKVFMPACLKFY